MFNDICFYVKGNMIEVNGRDFLLGELSASCMNIPPAEFEEIYDKYKSAEYIMNHEINAEKDIAVEYIPPSKEDWLKLNGIRSLAWTGKPFKAVCHSLLKRKR